MDQETRLHADVTMEAVVVRCGCPDVETGWERHGKLNQSCPNPKSTQDLGEVARTHFEGPDAIAQYLRWRDTAGSSPIPFMEARLPQHLRR